MNARSLDFVIPGDLESLTGGYGYDRRIICGLRELGWRVEVHSLDDSFPFPTASALEQASRLFSRLDEHSTVLVDGLAGGVLPELLEAHATRLRLVALVHHPLAAESGLTSNVAADFARLERRSLQAVRHVVVTSRATRHSLGNFGISPERISVVEPGTDPAPLSHRGRGDSAQLLCVATLIPRKGHDLLFEALAPLASQRWHLICAGSLGRSPETFARLREQLQTLGLMERVTLTGDMDGAALARLYRESDLFVLPTRYEGFGMAVAEARAYGLPIISTSVGAIPQLVGPDAGILVAPDNANSLCKALSRVLRQPAELDRLRHGAAAARDTLPNWNHASAAMGEVLHNIIRRAAP